MLTRCSINGFRYPIRIAVVLFAIVPRLQCFDLSVLAIGVQTQLIVVRVDKRGDNATDRVGPIAEEPPDRVRDFLEEDAEGVDDSKAADR